MSGRHVLAFLALAGFAFAVQAQEAPQPAPKGPAMQERCAANPKACERLKERHDAFCKDNPQRCEELKAKREEMRQKCKQDPAACDKAREEMRAKAREQFEQRCKEDPKRCDDMKKRFVESRGKRHGDRPAPAPVAPASAPAQN